MKDTVMKKGNKGENDFGSSSISTEEADPIEVYRNSVERIEFSIGGYGGDSYLVSVEKTDQGAHIHVQRWEYGHRECEPTDDFDITRKRWENLVEKLYEKIRIHEWKRRYKDPDILDGTQWSLMVFMKDEREACISGSNSYPPNFNELLRAFRAFAKDIH